MRKLLLFSSVFVLGVSAIPLSQVNAVIRNPDVPISNNSVSGGGIKVDIVPEIQSLMSGIENVQEESSEAIIRNITQNLGDQTNALQTTAGITLSSEAAMKTAQDYNATTRAQQGVFTDIRLKHTDQPAVICPLGSVTPGLGRGEGAARAQLRQELEERFSILNCEAGTICENGRTDMNLRLYEMAMQFCSPAGMGGSAVDCTGADDLNSIEHLSVGTLLAKTNIGEGTPTSADDVEQLMYLQNLLYGQAPLSLNPDLLENPTTEIKNLYVEADRMRAQLGIGQTAFSNALSRRILPPDDGEVGPRPFLVEILSAGNFLPPSEIEEILPPGRRPSLHGQLEAITLGMLNPNYVLQQIDGNPEHAGLTIVFNTALANRLLFEQLKELEQIKLAISSDIAASRFDDLNALNARIRAANQR